MPGEDRLAGPGRLHNYLDTQEDAVSIYGEAYKDTLWERTRALCWAFHFIWRPSLSR